MLTRKWWLGSAGMIASISGQLVSGQPGPVGTQLPGLGHLRPVTSPRGPASLHQRPNWNVALMLAFSTFVPGASMHNGCRTDAELPWARRVPRTVSHGSAGASTECERERLRSKSRSRPVFP